MGYGTTELANLPVVNRQFTIEQLPQSGTAPATTSIGLIDEINRRLDANTTLDPRSYNYRSIVISNDHATVPVYIRSAGADVGDRGIVVNPGESLFLALDGLPNSTPTPVGETPVAGAAPGNELRYQCIDGYFSVAVFY